MPRFPHGLSLSPKNLRLKELVFKIVSPETSNYTVAQLDCDHNFSISLNSSISAFIGLFISLRILTVLYIKKQPPFWYSEISFGLKLNHLKMISLSKTLRHTDFTLGYLRAPVFTFFLMAHFHLFLDALHKLRPFPSL